jgi:hypothetical protein
MGDRTLPPRTDLELARLLERGGDLGGRRGGPLILRRCRHEPGKLKITARGKHSIVVVCSCGSGTLAVLMPERPLKPNETEAIIAIARESEW